MNIKVKRTFRYEYSLNQNWFSAKLIFIFVLFYFYFLLKKEIERFLNDDEELLKTAKIILQNVSAAPTNIFSNDHNGLTH